MAFLDFLPVIGDVVGAFSNLLGTSSTNEANLQATRETNENNYKMFQEQLGFTREMWNKNNQYNSPQNQRSLYQAAGINPYLALGNMASGEASMASTPSPNPMQVPHVEAPQIGSFIADSGRSYVDSVIKRQQAESLGLDNKAKLISLRYKETNEILDLYNKRQDLISKGVKTESDRKQIEFLNAQINEKQTNLRYLDDYLKSRNDREREEANRTKNEADKAFYEAQTAQEILRWCPRIQSATLNSLKAQAYSAYQSGEASKEAAKTTKTLRPAQYAAETLKVALQRRDVKLADLNLSAAQLEDARRKDLIERRGNSWVFKNVDGFVNWLTKSAGNVFTGFK